MAKKVLVIEQSLAVRGVAESLLRQNGFEVVSAESQAAAMDILGASKIDLILVSSEITTDSGQPLYEQFGEEKSTAGVPIVILHDPNTGSDPAYPPESIIAKPFTPRDFLTAIGPFVGSEQTVSTSEQTPFSGADFEDALIDTALGLDKIEVDDAEIMEDDTGIYRKQNKKGVTESLIGFDIKVNADDTTKNVRGKIESVNVPAETNDIPDPAPSTDDIPQPVEQPVEALDRMEEDTPPPKPDAGLSESSKIEIITDQYGIASIPETAELIKPDEDEDKAHDYDWFLSELRREASGEKTPAPKDETPITPQISLDDKPLKADAAAQFKQPAAKKPEPKPESKEPATHGEAIDKFISEFKKEVDKITGDAADQITVATIAADDSEPPRSGDLNWEERLEKMPEDQVKLMSREIVEAVAKQVARQLIARIDPDVVYHLIKAAVEGRLGREEKKPTHQT